MVQPNEIQKWVWTEDDFESMGWHDCRIYAVAFSPETCELLLDLDYMLEWIKPEPPNRYFDFWIAPATLVFENVHGLEFDVSPIGRMDIADILRAEPGKPYNSEYIGRDSEWVWTISCQEGDIKLHSTGYKQYFRSQAQYIQSQRIDLSVRGGYSFAKGRTDSAPQRAAARRQPPLNCGKILHVLPMESRECPLARYAAQMRLKNGWAARSRYVLTS